MPCNLTVGWNLLNLQILLRLNTQRMSITRRELNTSLADDIWFRVAAREAIVPACE